MQCILNTILTSKVAGTLRFVGTLRLGLVPCHILCNIPQPCDIWSPRGQRNICASHYLIRSYERTPVPGRCNIIRKIARCCIDRMNRKYSSDNILQFRSTEKCLWPIAKNVTFGDIAMPQRSRRAIDLRGDYVPQPVTPACPIIDIATYPQPDPWVKYPSDVANLHRPDDSDRAPASSSRPAGRGGGTLSPDSGAATP